MEQLQLCSTVNSADLYFWFTTQEFFNLDGERLHTEDLNNHKLSKCVGAFYRARKQTIASLPTFCNVCCLQYASFVLQGRNTVNETMDGCM